MDFGNPDFRFVKIRQIIMLNIVKGLFLSR